MKPRTLDKSSGDCKAPARIARNPKHSATKYLVEFLIVISRCNVGMVCGRAGPGIRRAVFERLSGSLSRDTLQQDDYFLASPLIRPGWRRRQAILVVKIAVFEIIRPGVTA